MTRLALQSFSVNGQAFREILTNGYLRKGKPNIKYDNYHDLPFHQICKL